MRRAGVFYYAQAQLTTWSTNPDNEKRKFNRSAKSGNSDDGDGGHSGPTTTYYLELSDRERSSAYK